ncbi:MAG: PKD domain-containing protein [Thermoplasmata archaeon]
MKLPKGNKVKISYIFILLVVFVLVIGMIPAAQGKAQQQGKVDILVDGEDVGNQTTLYITKDEGNNLSLSLDINGIPSDNISEISWDFGDGNTETGEKVDHVFKLEDESERIFSVNVTVKSDNKTYTDSLDVKAVKDERGTFLTALGAGLAVGIAGMGAGIGVGIAGAAGAGTIAEKPEKFGKCLVFQALPQTQAIYGLLTAVLLLLFTGVIGGGDYVPMSVGIASVGVGLAVGIAGLSAIGQGIAASGSMAAYSEKEELFGRGMVFSVLPETQAIYGLLVGILIMVFTGLLGGGITSDLLGDKGLGLAVISIGAGLAVGVAGLSGIGQGIAAGAGIGSVAEKEDLFGKSMVFSVLPETQAIYGMLVAILLMVFSGLLGGSAKDMMAGMSGYSLGLIGIGAGLAVGVAGLSGIGQGIAAASGIGSVAEKEEIFGRGMVFSVLPETQAIYGMLIAILLMIFSGLLGSAGLVNETPEIQMFLGLVGVGAGLSVGVAGLSGIGQGVAAASGIATVAEDEGMFGRGMVFSVLPETQAIYGMLIAILLMVFSGMLSGTYPEGSGVGMGIAAVGAGLAIGIAGVSGVGQGITSGSAIAAVSKREDTFGKGMIFSVMSETFAIFGLLIAIFIIVFLGFM